MQLLESQVQLRRAWRRNVQFITHWRRDAFDRAAEALGHTWLIINSLLCIRL